MGAKLCHFRGLGGSKSGIFNKLGFTGPLKFCSFANPGKTLSGAKRLPGITGI